MVDALHENGIECLMEFCFAPGTPLSVLSSLQVLALTGSLAIRSICFHLVGDARWQKKRPKMHSKTKLIFLWL